MLSFPLGTLNHHAALNGAGDEVVPPLASPVQTRSRRFAGHPFRTLTFRGNGVESGGGPTLLDAPHDGAVRLGGICAATLTHTTSHVGAVRTPGITVAAPAQSTAHNGAVRTAELLSPTSAVSTSHVGTVRTPEALIARPGVASTHVGAVRLADSILTGMGIAVRHDGLVRLLGDSIATTTAPPLDGSHSGTVALREFFGARLSHATAHESVTRTPTATVTGAAQSTSSAGTVRLAERLASVGRLLAVTHSTTDRLRDLAAPSWSQGAGTDGLVRLTGATLATAAANPDAAHSSTVRSGGAFLAVGRTQATAHSSATVTRDSFIARYGIAITHGSVVRLSELLEATLFGGRIIAGIFGNVRHGHLGRAVQAGPAVDGFTRDGHLGGHVSAAHPLTGHVRTNPAVRGRTRLT
jgi:hypothetical protein